MIDFLMLKIKLIQEKDEEIEAVEMFFKKKSENLFLQHHKT